MMALEAPRIGHDPVCIGAGHLRSRGPMWPVAKSGKMAPLLSRRPVTYRCALFGEYSVRAEIMIDRHLGEVFASVTDADNDLASP